MSQQETDVILSLNQVNSLGEVESTTISSDLIVNPTTKESITDVLESMQETIDSLQTQLSLLVNDTQT